MTAFFHEMSGLLLTGASPGATLKAGGNLGASGGAFEGEGSVPAFT